MNPEVVYLLGVTGFQLSLIAAVVYWLRWRERELEETLNRYRKACSLVYRWNASVKNSSETAEWIAKCGEGRQAMDIEGFRNQLDPHTKYFTKPGAK